MNDLERITMSQPTGVEVFVTGRNALIVSLHQLDAFRKCVVERADVPDLIRLLTAFMERR